MVTQGKTRAPIHIRVSWRRPLYFGVLVAEDWSGFYVGFFCYD
jgi:hypothetical protein